MGKISSILAGVAAVGVILAGGAEVNAQQAPARAQAPRAGVDKYWTSPDGMRFHYIELGRGTPVILIHGNGSRADRWFENGIAQSLARTNRVIAIDMRNHGLTTPNPAPAGGNMARDVLAFMDAQNIRKAHIGGFSMGGSVTSQLMAIAPERFITAHFGGSGVNETPEFADKVPADKTGPLAIEEQAVAQANAARATQPGPMAQASVAARGGAAAPAAPAAPGAGRGGGAPAVPPLDLTKINFPVLAVVGEYDTPYRKTHRLYRELHDFQLVILPGRGHMSSIVQGFMPPAYPEALTRFIVANNPK